MRLAFLCFIVLFWLQNSCMKSLPKRKRQFSLSCSFNHTINISNISTLDVRLGYDKVIKTLEGELYYKCPSLLILLDSLKSFCNFQRSCSITHTLIEESLKLCPATDLYIKYECIEKKENSSEKAQQIHSSFYCLNNHHIILKETTFLFSDSDPVKGFQVGCPHDSSLRSIFIKHCQHASHCIVPRSDFEDFVKDCKATHFRVSMQCTPVPTEDISRLYNSEGETDPRYSYHLECPYTMFIGHIRTTALEYGARRSKIECHNIDVFERIVEVSCLGKNYCQVNDSVVNEVNQLCGAIHFVLVEYTCEYQSSAVLRKVGCDDDKVMDVKMAVEDLREDSVHLCTEAIRIVLGIQQRCAKRSQCELSALEMEAIEEDDCLQGEQAKVVFACQNAEDLPILKDRNVKVCVDGGSSNSTCDTSGLSYIERKTETSNRHSKKKNSSLKVLDDILESIYVQNRDRNKRSATKTNLSLEPNMRVNRLKVSKTKKALKINEVSMRGTDECKNIKVDEVCGYKVARLGSWDVSGRITFESNVPSSLSPVHKNLLISFDREFTPISIIQERTSQKVIENLCVREDNCDFFILKLPPHHIAPPFRKPKNDKELLFNILKNEHKRNKSKSFLKALRILNHREGRSVDLPFDGGGKNEKENIWNITVCLVGVLMCVLSITLTSFLSESLCFKQNREPQIVILPEEVFNYKCDSPITSSRRPSNQHNSNQDSPLTPNSLTTYFNNHQSNRNWADHNDKHILSYQSGEVDGGRGDVSDGLDRHQDYLSNNFKLVDRRIEHKEQAPKNHDLRSEQDATDEVTMPLLPEKIESSNEKKRRICCKALCNCFKKPVDANNSNKDNNYEELVTGEEEKKIASTSKVVKEQSFPVTTSSNIKTLGMLLSAEKKISCEEKIILEPEDENEEDLSLKEDLEKEIKSFISSCTKSISGTPAGLSGKLLATKITAAETPTSVNVMSLLGKTKQEIKSMGKNLAINRSLNKKPIPKVKVEVKTEEPKFRRKMTQEEFLKIISKTDKAIVDSVLSDLSRSEMEYRPSRSSESQRDCNQSASPQSFDKSLTSEEASETSEDISSSLNRLRESLLSNKPSRKNRSVRPFISRKIKSVEVSETVASTVSARFSKAEITEVQLSSEFFISPSQESQTSDYTCSASKSFELTEELVKSETGSEKEEMEKEFYLEEIKKYKNQKNLVFDKNENEEKTTFKNESFSPDKDDTIEESTDEQIELATGCDWGEWSCGGDSEKGSEENGKKEGKMTSISSSEHSSSTSMPVRRGSCNNNCNTHGNNNCNNNCNTNCNTNCNNKHPLSPLDSAADVTIPQLKPPRRLVCPEGLLVEVDQWKDDEDEGDEGDESEEERVRKTEKTVFVHKDEEKSIFISEKIPSKGARFKTKERVAKNSRKAFRNLIVVENASNLNELPSEECELLLQ